METTEKGYQNYEVSALATVQYIGKFISESDRSAETKRVYANALRIFVGWAEDLPLSAPIIRTFKTYLLNKELAPNTVSVYLSAIKQFLSYLVEKGVMPFNPAKEVKRPRVPKTHQRDAITADHARKLLNIVPQQSLKDHRDFAMINLMLRTGIREIEVSRAKVGDIKDKEGERILEIHGKGRASKDTFVVLTEEACQPIAEYLVMRSGIGSKSPLFGSVGNRSQGGLSTRAIRTLISHYLIAAGLKSRRITPHSLRHTAITLAIEGGKGANIVQVQQMARHENISTTMLYFHEFNRIKNAAERAIQF